MITLKINIRKIVRIVFSHGTLIFSAFILFLYLADITEPSMMFINSSDTGLYLFFFCIFTFVSAVLYLGFRMRGAVPEESGGSAVLAALPHAVMIMSLLLETLTITNRFNHSMEFITSDLSKLVILLLAIFGGMCALCLAECEMRETETEQETEHSAEQGAGQGTKQGAEHSAKITDRDGGYRGKF